MVNLPGSESGWLIPHNDYRRLPDRHSQVGWQPLGAEAVGFRSSVTPWGWGRARAVPAMAARATANFMVSLAN